MNCQLLIWFWPTGAISPDSGSIQPTLTVSLSLTAGAAATGIALAAGAACTGATSEAQPSQAIAASAPLEIDLRCMTSLLSEETDGAQVSRARAEPAPGIPARGLSPPTDDAANLARRGRRS